MLSVKLNTTYNPLAQTCTMPHNRHDTQQACWVCLRYPACGHQQELRLASTKVEAPGEHFCLRHILWDGHCEHARPMCMLHVGTSGVDTAWCASSLTEHCTRTNFGDIYSAPPLHYGASEVPVASLVIVHDQFNSSTQPCMSHIRQPRQCSTSHHMN